MNNLFYKKVPSTFDGFVETMTITEGLITTYDIIPLFKRLETYFENRIQIIKPDSDDFLDKDFDWRVYSFVTNIQNYNKNDELKLNELLNIFGYFISLQTKHTDYIRFTIEPKYPIIINEKLKEKNIQWLYHITHKSNLEKIKKYGLAPRGSETTFYHPDDRIYLIISNMLGLITFKNLLARNKNKPMNSFIVFKIPFNNSYKYYLDDTSTLPKYDVTGCFILQNIPPNELETVNIKE